MIRLDKQHVIYIRYREELPKAIIPQILKQTSPMIIKVGIYLSVYSSYKP